MKVDTTTNYAVVQGSIVKTGPYFTFELSDDMALDVYYQIAPAFAIEVWHGDTYGLGAVHSLGVGYRFNILSVGLDYNFGNITDLEMIGSSIDEFEKEWYKYRTNHLRLFVGIKL